MPRSLLRPVLAAITIFVPCAGGALAACSGGNHSSQSDTGDASDGSIAVETSTPEAGDSSTQHDGPDAAADSSATDGTGGGDVLEAGATPPFFDAGDCGVGPSGEPTDLGCTGLYSDWASKTIATDAVEYDPGLHFWSDGAQKTRWISIPAGQKIDTSDMDEWTFPVGTRIWKEFRLPQGDASTETRIETRLLWKTGPYDWYRTTYVWSADGNSTATELTTGEVDAGGTSYEIPNQTQCDSCHSGRKDGVLGFEAVALSTPLASGITIQTLTSQGLITAAPAAPIVIPGDPTAVAALGWLHTNCGVSCHNETNGAASFTHFYMRLDVGQLTSVQTTKTYTTGWNVQTTGFQILGVPTTYRLHACDPGSSCVYYRADHRDGVNGTPGGTQMPPIVTHVVDAVDVAAVAAWIDDGCDAGDGG